MGVERAQAYREAALSVSPERWALVTAVEIWDGHHGHYRRWTGRGVRQSFVE